MDAGLQIDFGFNTESEYFHLRSFFTFRLMGLEGPPNHPFSNVRAFRVNVNKHGSF